MKKQFSFIAALLLFAGMVLPLFAEDAQNFQQYQLFSWKKISNAGKYQIDVEKQNGDGMWENVVSVQTLATQKEVLLYPGEYRVSISAYNKLGKKASSSNWVTFTVLNETEPYLYADYLKPSASWNSPCLHIKQVDPNAQNIQPQNDIDDEQVVASAGDPPNSFLLKAKNVFFPETIFSLVPVDASNAGGAPFVSFVDKRKTVPLTIIRRDRDHDGIVIAYNPDDLFSGYYDIVVKNPGGKTASLCILVLADRTPVIESEQFEYDEQYKTRVLQTENGSSSILSITGSGFDNGTTFTFTPTSEGIPYPYATNRERESIPLSLTGRKSIDANGRMQLDFTMDSMHLKTGYYNFSAGGGAAGTASILLLVKVNDSSASVRPVVNNVSSAYNKTTNTITFTVKGNDIDGAKFMLVSAFNKETGENSKIPLTQLDSKWGGTKLILDADASLIKSGKYILMVEKNDGSLVKYVEVNEHKVTLDKKISDDEKELFTRPVDYVESKVAVENKNEPVVTATPLVSKVTGTNRFFMPFLFFDMDLCGVENSNMNVNVHANFDVLDFGWCAFKSGMAFGLINHNLMFGCSAEFGIPVINYFAPYAGVGIDINDDIDFSQISSDSFITFTVTAGTQFISGLGNVSANFFGGVVLFDFLDFKYVCRLNNVWMSTDPTYFSDEFSIGCRLPLRLKKYTKQIKGMTTTIAVEGPISGNEVTCDPNTVELLFANGVTEVSYFNNMSALTKITLPDTVKVIGTSAFENDENVTSIVIPSSVTYIGPKAFANCTMIKVITIPSSVVKIDATAFDGWQTMQSIYLGWNEDEDSEHDLAGLESNDRLFVYYLSGKKYVGN